MPRSPENIPTTVPIPNESNAMGLTPNKRIDPCEALADPAIVEKDLQTLKELKEESMEWERNHAEILIDLLATQKEPLED